MNDEYKLHRILGEGSHSKVYLALDARNNHVAVKVIREGKNVSHEAEILELLNDRFTVGVPRLITWGRNEMGSIIVQQLLGETIRARWNRVPGRLIDCGPQMIERLESIHRVGLVHRDIKPDNWLYGLKRNHKLLYLIDYGLADSYLTEKGEHVPYIEQDKFIGNYLYSSPFTGLGYPHSRRDDLISLGYLLISLYRTLPWNELRRSQSSSSESGRFGIALARMKFQSKFVDGIPKGLQLYIELCLTLKFDENPPYKQLIYLLS